MTGSDFGFERSLGLLGGELLQGKEGKTNKEATAVVQVTSDGGLGRDCGLGNKEK